ncbi:hypothetical protein BKA82DRAFT_2393572 [Pisolithus tinctorius]|nr:hypothetical protein BKA82DRAFT_2393572 [Pisolithus tinctorius]
MGVLIVSFAMIAVRAIGTRAHVTCDALDGLLVLVVCRSIDNWVGSSARYYTVSQLLFHRFFFFLRGTYGILNLLIGLFGFVAGARFAAV